MPRPDLGPPNTESLDEARKNTGQAPEGFPHPGHLALLKATPDPAPFDSDPLRLKIGIHRHGRRTDTMLSASVTINTQDDQVSKSIYNPPPHVIWDAPREKYRKSQESSP